MLRTWNLMLYISGKYPCVVLFLIEPEQWTLQCPLYSIMHFRDTIFVMTLLFKLNVTNLDLLTWINTKYINVGNLVKYNTALQVNSVEVYFIFMPTYELLSWQHIAICTIADQWISNMYTLCILPRWFICGVMGLNVKCGMAYAVNNWNNNNTDGKWSFHTEFQLSFMPCIQHFSVISQKAINVKSVSMP